MSTLLLMKSCGSNDCSFAFFYQMLTHNLNSNDVFTLDTLKKGNQFPCKYRSFRIYKRIKCTYGRDVSRKKIYWILIAHFRYVRTHLFLLASAVSWRWKQNQFLLCFFLIPLNNPQIVIVCSNVRPTIEWYFKRSSMTSFGTAWISKEYFQWENDKQNIKLHL